MQVVVVGCGRVGSQLATLLASEGHNVAVVDESADSFKRLGATFNGLLVQGMGYDEDILRQAGIEQADALAAVTNYDNVNLVTAEVATRIFNVPKVVVRLDNPEHEKSYQKIGVDYVCGTKMVATAILNHLHKGTFRHHVAFPSADIAVVEFVLGELVEGKTVKEMEIPATLRIASIVRNGTYIIPDGNTPLHKGDLVVAAAKKGAFSQIKSFLTSQEVKK